MNAREEVIQSFKTWKKVYKFGRERGKFFFMHMWLLVSGYIQAKNLYVNNEYMLLEF